MATRPKRSSRSSRRSRSGKRFGNAARIPTVCIPALAMKATTKTGREIERAAAARFDYAALGIDGARVFYNPNRRAWMIELDTDPAQYFVAERGEDGAFHFEDVT